MYHLCNTTTFQLYASSQSQCFHLHIQLLSHQILEQNSKDPEQSDVKIAIVRQNLYKIPEFLIEALRKRCRESVTKSRNIGASIVCKWQAAWRMVREPAWS